MSEPDTPPSDSEAPVAPARGPGAGFTFLYYFVGTALVGTLLARQILHVPLASGIPNQLGSVLGLVGGLAGTYFNAAKTLEIPMRGRRALLQRLEPVLADMGYQPAAIDAEADADPNAIAVYERDALSGLFSGKIYVTFGAKTAVISSRATHIRALSRRLTQAS